MAIRAFATKFEKHLPADVKAALAVFVKDHSDKFHGKNSGGFNTRQMVMIGVTALGTLNGRVTYGLANTQAAIRRRSERAFLHLQRSIQADPDQRKKWKAAFKGREPDCEKLGGLHLLSHGIWAFKADAAQGRTDLILGEPLEDLNDVDRAADGLVLTEWKLARNPSEIDRMFAAAKRQAEQYSGGMLAGYELRDYRYLVVVTERAAKPPADFVDGAVTYRHIIVAADPQTPSKTK